jgi:hypothetical protein
MKVNADQWTKLHPSKETTQGGQHRCTKLAIATGIADTGASVLCSGLFTSLGMLPVIVSVVGHPDVKKVQALYITKELKKLYISKKYLMELRCLPTTWPYPGTSRNL